MFKNAFIFSVQNNAGSDSVINFHFVAVILKLLQFYYPLWLHWWISCTVFLFALICCTKSIGFNWSNGVMLIAQKTTKGKANIREIIWRVFGYEHHFDFHFKAVSFHFTINLKLFTDFSDLQTLFSYPFLACNHFIHSYLAVKNGILYLFSVK